MARTSSSGHASGNRAGDVTYKSFTSVNGAENALGFDIDGVTGVSNASGPVTVVFVNTDGGAPSMAFVLLNTEQRLCRRLLLDAAAPTRGNGDLNPDYMIAA